MASTNYGKLEYMRLKLENNLMNREVVRENDLRIHRDIYLRDITAIEEESLDCIETRNSAKKIDVLICTKEEEVLLAICIVDGEVECQTCRIATFEFGIDNIGDWTVDTIVEWLEKKLQANEKYRYKYTPPKYRKRVKRIPLQERLESLMEDLI